MQRLICRLTCHGLRLTALLAASACAPLGPALPPALPALPDRMAPGTSSPSETWTTAAPAATWRTLHPGLRYAVVSPWPNSRVHVLQLDLREPRLRLQVSPPHTRGMTMDRLAQDSQVLASINASFFGRQHVPRGLTVSNGVPWDDVFLPETSPALACDRAQRCRMHFSPPAAPPARWFNAVAGTPRLVRDGVARIAADDDSCTSLCARTHPRTTVGLDASGHTLTWVLAEGRRGPVVGLALAPLAQWMVGMGVHNAINLDGGGSSTLWLQGQAVMARPANEPAERALSAVLQIVRVEVTDLP
jgi:Phosphodiester glycosidase